MTTPEDVLALHEGIVVRTGLYVDEPVPAHVIVCARCSQNWAPDGCDAFQMAWRARRAEARVAALEKAGRLVVDVYSGFVVGSLLEPIEVLRAALAEAQPLTPTGPRLDDEPTGRHGPGGAEE